MGADAPPTVYRALDFLMANGFVHKLESVNAFVACHHPSSAAHSVAVPDLQQLPQRGGNWKTARSSPSWRSAPRSWAFQPQAQTLEVHGLCARCAGLTQR